MDLSIVIPAYNEAERLPAALIEAVDYLNGRSLDYEIIVVNDGSTDATADVVSRFSKLASSVKLLSLPRNSGKGCAVRSGVLESSGEKVLFADADGSTPIKELERLERVLDGGIDVAIGSRALPSKHTKVETNWYRKFLGRIFNRVVNYLIVPDIADTQCGFKMFTRRAADFIFSRQKSNGFGFDVEILHIAQKVQMRIVEVPINWRNVPGSKVSLFSDAARMLIDTLKFRIRHRKLQAGLWAEHSQIGT